MPDTATPLTGAAEVQRVHVLSRRARLRAPSEMARDALVDLANRLAEVPGVDRVLARPSTCSLIVECHRDAAEVLSRMEGEGLIRVTAPPPRPPVRQTVQLGLAQADMSVQKRTNQALDLRTALGLALLAGAILQLGRGRVAGPATTMAMAALTLLDSGQGKR